MADTSRIRLLGLPRKSEAEPDADFPRDGARALARALMEAGVGRRLGAADLAAPRSREGGLIPSLLGPGSNRASCQAACAACRRRHRVPCLSIELSAAGSRP